MTSLVWDLQARLGAEHTCALVDALDDCRACHLPGDPGRFAGLFDDARLRRAIAAAAGRPHSFGALVTDPLGDGLTFSEPIDPSTIDHHLSLGRTICATDVTAFDAGLEAVARGIAHTLGCVGSLRFNAYLSPAGAHTPMHTDTRASTTLQLRGRKRWRYQERPARPYPDSNAQVDRWGAVVRMRPSVLEPPPPPDRHELVEVTLCPGDLLSVPAGAWHEVLTEQDGLALNLSIRPMSAVELVQRLVVRAFTADDRWRRGLPLGAASPSGSSLDQVVACVRERLAELTRWSAELDAKQVVMDLRK